MLAEIWNGQRVQVQFTPNLCSSAETTDLKRRIVICCASTMCFVRGFDRQDVIPTQGGEHLEENDAPYLTPEQLTRVTQRHGVSSVLDNWQREVETESGRTEEAAPLASEQGSNAKVVEKEQYVTIKPSTVFQGRNDALVRCVRTSRETATPKLDAP